ncbi:MAG: pilus assembly protein PilP [Thiopseudomonas sp.]|nr:pilus assembly protein PilP [Thiopseudomonas sp.]MCK9464287.1 pilus assembly protein PilP [Thiopseudomonas sp.]
MKCARYLLLAMLSSALLGCSSGEHADLQAFMDEVRAQPRGRIEAMPEEVVYEPFTYIATGLRSPFQPPVKLEQAQRERGRSGLMPDDARVKQFLESFNIETFVMVGTLANKEGLYALIRGGDGVHRVRAGDYLGRNHGRITEINADAVEVVELVPDGEGGWLERPRTLMLQERS